MTNKNKGKKLHNMLKSAISIALMVTLIMTTPGLIPNMENPVTDEAHAYNPNYEHGVKMAKQTFYCGEPITVNATSAAPDAWVGLFSGSTVPTGSGRCLGWYYTWNSSEGNPHGDFDGTWCDIRKWDGAHGASGEPRSAAKMVENVSRKVRSDYIVVLFETKDYSTPVDATSEVWPISVSHYYGAGYGGSDATCTAVAKCACGSTSGSINPNNHTGSSTWGGTSGVHTKYSCCGATISTTHSYTRSEKDSYVRYTCACGYYYDVNKYYLDVNHTLDGTNLGNSKDSAVGTFDVHVGGSRVADDAGDYYTRHEKGSSYTVNDIKAKTGYRYLGNSSYSGSIPANNTAVVLAWARNTYTVVYNGNGATGGSTANSSHSYGVAKNLTANGFSRTGYTFAGWNTAANGSGTNYSNQQSVSNLTSTHNGTVNLYAKWTPITYSVKYDSNGGSGTMSNSSHTYGTAKALTQNSFTREGYRFAGWNTRTDGTGTSYADKASVTNLTSTNNGTVTLYAKWVQIFYYDLNFYVNGTSLSDANIATADVYINGTLVGDNVADYYVQHDKGTTFKVDDVKVNSAYTIYAESNKSGTINQKCATAIYIGSNYTVTYKANGGSGSDVTQKVNYGTAWTSKPNTTFVRPGYTLTSWNTATDGSGTEYDVNAGQTDTQGSNVTLYAQWDATPYKITYDTNGGSEVSPLQYTVETESIKLADAPTKENHVFEGWKLETAEGNWEAKVYDATEMFSTGKYGNITLVAQWRRLTCDIEVDVYMDSKAVVHPAHGTPVVIVRLVDDNDPSKVYYRAAEFGLRPIEAVAILLGAAEIDRTVEFNDIPVSKYTLTQVDTYRHKQESVEPMDGTQIGEAIKFDMSDKPFATAVITNTVDKHQWFGHNDLAVFPAN